MKCILVDVWGQREDKERGGVYCCWDTIYKLGGEEVMREKVGRITTTDMRGMRGVEESWKVSALLFP